MSTHPQSLKHHRAQADSLDSVLVGEVRYAPVKSLWFITMLLGATVGGLPAFTWSAFAVFVVLTVMVQPFLQKRSR